MTIGPNGRFLLPSPPNRTRLDHISQFANACTFPRLPNHRSISQACRPRPAKTCLSPRIRRLLPPLKVQAISTFMLFSRDARFLRRPSHRRVWNAPLRLHSGDIFDAGLFRIWAYYCLASLLGIIVSLIFLGYAYHTAPRQESIVLWLDPECTSPSQCPVVANSSVRASGEIRPGFSSFVAPCDRGWTLERVKNMVSRTKGYYARDYSAFLGWNNV